MTIRGITKWGTPCVSVKVAGRRGKNVLTTSAKWLMSQVPGEDDQLGGATTFSLAEKSPLRMMSGASLLLANVAIALQDPLERRKSEG